MTLVEVLVVLAIIGISWFAVLPNLNIGKDVGHDSELDPFNSRLAEIRSEAMHNGTIQRLEMNTGQKEFVWKEKNATFPLPGVLARIQTDATTGTVHSFGRGRPATVNIYPAGFMDQVRMVFADGQVLTTDPLTAKVTRSE